MAISIIGLVGRIGAMVGSGFVGPLLIGHCTPTLNTFASIILCCAVAAKITLARLENYYKLQL